MKEDEIKKAKRTSPYVILTAIMTTTFLIFIFFGVNIWKEYKKAVIDTQKNQMLLTAQSIAGHLEVFIDGYKEDLNSLYAGMAVDIEEYGEANWTTLREYADHHKRFIYDVIVEDAQGTVLKSLNEYQGASTHLVTQIDENIKLYQTKLTNGEIYLLMRREGASGDALSFVIDSKGYFQTLMLNLRLGTSGYIVIKDSAGTILMHPNDGQIGIHVIEGRHQIYPQADLDSLTAMTTGQLSGKEGIEEYYSYWWNEPDMPRVKKISAYTPAFIGDDFWVVSAVIAYNDLYAPLAEGVFKLVMVFCAAFVTIIVIAWYLARLLLQRKKDTEEIAYLTELNQILAEMYQSEETMAHQQRLQIIGTMTGGVTHEFNNLLTPIMGYAELILAELTESDSPGLYDYAEEICEASAKAKEIIQQISSLSRKNMETVYRNISAEIIIKRAIKMVVSVCPANIRLIEDIDFKDAYILGNETQVNQMILNIAVNAIHAIGHQEGTVTIKGTVVESTDPELRKLSSPIQDSWSRYIRIDIADTGCGMSEEVLKQIFDPFFTTKKDGKGTGLGLTLVEQIARSHKGYANVESQLGKGTVFRIYLPVNEQKEQEMKIQKSETIADLRLLIVDDNSKVLQLLKKNFAKIAMEVTVCMDLEEARTELKQQPFDVLVIEQDVGGKSALDFCMSIQGQHSELIKIVMIDKVTREIVEAKRRKMIDGYIDKPVSDSAILKAVRNCISEL